MKGPTVRNEYESESRVFRGETGRKKRVRAERTVTKDPDREQSQPLEWVRQQRFATGTCQPEASPVPTLD